MRRKWFSVAALIIAAIVLLSVSSCGDPQELVSISVAPVNGDFRGFEYSGESRHWAHVQLRPLATYVHPPVTKDITNQVVWASNDTQMVPSILQVW